MKFKILVVLAVLMGFEACKTTQPFLAEGAATALANHTRVAILPFKVTFNDNYKQMSARSNANNWREQERVAGLDMQKSAFLNLSKRAEKKHLGITVQDFITTNKTLEREGIRFSHLATMNKDQLARILMVDAVLWGESTMEWGMTSRNGMKSSLSLYDGSSNFPLWVQSDFQTISNRMDSPQYLATRTVDQLVRSLPYNPRQN